MVRHLCRGGVAGWRCTAMKMGWRVGRGQGEAEAPLLSDDVGAQRVESQLYILVASLDLFDVSYH